VLWPLPPPRRTARAPRRYTYPVNRTKSPAHRLARWACLASLTAALLTTGCSSQPRATGTISGQLLGYGGPPALEPNGSMATRSPFPVEGTITVHGSGGTRSPRKPPRDSPWWSLRGPTQ
jgi:hypothetical protein